MAQSLSKVYVHITFSTKNRENLIDDNIEEELFAYIRKVCKTLECKPVKVGGYKNYVHVLCLLSKKIAQMELLEELKKRSSKWIKTKSEKYKNFYWQDGYGIFSVNTSEVDTAKLYIENQTEHHE